MKLPLVLCLSLLAIPAPAIAFVAMASHPGVRDWRRREA